MLLRRQVVKKSNIAKAIALRTQKGGKNCGWNGEQGGELGSDQVQCFGCKKAARLYGSQRGYLGAC